MKKLLIITDNHVNQINGVNTTLKNTCKYLYKHDIEYTLITPEHFPGFLFPLYPEVKICLPSRKILNILKQNYDYIHIQTEGPLGIYFRCMCCHLNLKFTTSYLTKISEIAYKLAKIPQCIGDLYVRWFHSKSSNIMVATNEVKKYLISKKIKSTISLWTKGVDTNLFIPGEKENYLLYVGRVSYEKGIEDFLECNIDKKKIIIGDGPAKLELEKKYPQTIFKGYLFGTDLAKAYAGAEVFVFPSKNDTFGLVMLEALACGTPIAAYPTMGSIEVINNKYVGCYNDNLEIAINNAIKYKDKNKCRERALDFSWERSCQQFVDNLIIAR